MCDIIKSLNKTVIVSCQAEENDPFNDPEHIALFAKAAQMGGAKGIRSEGLEKIKKIRQTVDLPLIGLIKSMFDDGFVRITGSINEVEQLIEAGCYIIAVDGTFRLREGLTGPEFISKIKKEYNCLVMADIARSEEGIACEHSGADCISTALSGYTPETKTKCDEPDFELIHKLANDVSIPVFAEGRLNTPEAAKKAIQSGAYAIIAGTAITRPRVITSWFVDKILNSKIK